MISLNPYTEGGPGGSEESVSKPRHLPSAHAPLAQQAATRSVPEQLIVGKFEDGEARAVPQAMVCESLRHHRVAKRLLHVVRNVPEVVDAARIPIRMLPPLTQNVVQNGMVWSSDKNTKLVTRSMCPHHSMGR